MTAKTSPGRFLRRRSFHFAGTRNWLLAVGVFVLVGAQASAFTAYVSNEKSNTISVVDTDKFTVVKTIKVGQRPRGIELTREGKFILVAVGDDTSRRRKNARDRRHSALWSRSRAVYAGSRRQDYVCGQRKRQHGHDNRLGTAGSARGGTGRRRAGRHGP